MTIYKSQTWSKATKLIPEYWLYMTECPSRNPNGDISVNKKMKAGPTIVEGHVWGMRTHQPNLASFWDQIVEATRNELLSQAARLPEAWVDGQDPCIKGINLRLVLFLVWCLMEFCLKWVALSTIDCFVILQEFLDREKADKASIAAVWMIRPWQTHCCHVRLRKQSGNVQGYVSQLANYLSVCLSVCISIRIYVLPSMYISVWKKKKNFYKKGVPIGPDRCSSEDTFLHVAWSKHGYYGLSLWWSIP